MTWGILEIPTSSLAELLKAILALGHGVPLFHAGPEPMGSGPPGRTGSGKPPGEWEMALKPLKNQS